MSDENRVPRLSTNALLELSCAARPFIRTRSMRNIAERERLRRAVVDVMRERGLDVPPELATSGTEALESLRSVIHRCIELHVPWPDVVAIVNRETRE